MDADSLSFDEDGLECLDRETVKGRGAVQENGVSLGDLLENVPDLGGLTLDELLGTADRVDVTEFLESAYDEGLEQDERHLLGETALVELELGPDDDDRTARVVDALAEEVLTEASSLALEHVAEGLEGAVGGSGDGTAMAAVVIEGINGLLKHALLVADNDLGGLELEKRAETVVTVDDSAVEIVEIRGRETTTLERHQRTEVGRDHGKNREDHPLGTCARGDESLDELETLGELLADLLALGLRHLLLDRLLFLEQVKTLKQLGNRFGTHAGGEILAVLVLGLAELGLGQELSLLEGGLARIDHDVILVVDHALKLTTGKVEHEADARGHALVEPNVGDRHGQVDVAHAFTTDTAQADLHTATVADDVLVLDPLVLSAGALPVTGRTEDALAEESALLGLERAVVDGLRVLDLALAPTADGLGIGDGDVHLVERRLGGVGRGNQVGGGCKCCVGHGLERCVAFVFVSVGRFRASGGTVGEGGNGLTAANLDVESESLHLLDEHVERLGDTGLQRVVTLDDALVDARASLHVIGLDGEQFLERVGGTVGLKSPDLHLSEALSAVLGLAAERLLGDK